MRVLSCLMIAGIVIGAATVAQEPQPREDGGRIYRVEVTPDIGTSQEALLTKKNLLRIQQWIIQQGQRQTYCSKYGNNPYFATEQFDYYLDPDGGQQNGNCDLAKSGFHTLVVRAKDRSWNPYLRICFLPDQLLVLSISWPSEDLTVGQIQAYALKSVREILNVIPPEH